MDSALIDVVVQHEGTVATVEFSRPPHNHLSHELVAGLLDAMTELGENGCRSVVLCSEGKNFCAGADLQPSENSSFTAESVEGFYELGAKLFEIPIPIVAAVQGSAVGGGLGLTLAADFRVATPSTRFVANFARLGFHQGFGLSVTLPNVVGHQHALGMLYSGRRVSGEEAAAIGLCDHLVAEDQLRQRATELAFEISRSAPLAVRSIKKTMRGHLPSAIRNVLVRERGEQMRLQATDDWSEGVAAMAARRDPRFSGR